MSQEIDADEILDIQRNKNRVNYSDRLVRQAQNDDITQKPAIYSGFDPVLGLHKVTPVGGQPLTVARVITTGAIAIGQTVQLTRSNGALTAFVDELPQGSRPYGAGGGGAGAGSNLPSSGFSGYSSGRPSEDSVPCGYKVVGGEVEAQFECTEGDADLFDNAEDAIASVTGATCTNSTFPMTAPISYSVGNGSVIQSIRLVSGTWNDGTRLDQTCPALIINEARTTAGADFDTNYVNNSGSCVYRICTKVLENNYGCVTEGGEARCAYFPDGSGSYKTLEECEEAIAPSFTGGQCEGVIYFVDLAYEIFSYGTLYDSGVNRSRHEGPITGGRFYVTSGGFALQVASNGWFASSGFVAGQEWYSVGGGGGALSWSGTVAVSITREDGLLDNCGDPKKRCL